MTSASAAAVPSTPDNRLSPEVRRAGVVVVLGTIMAILDTTIVAVALPTLAKDFHVTVTTIQWVTTGYLLALAIVISLSGWAMHRFGGKPVYMTSLVLFLAGSILCGLAWSATALIAFRVLQGFGGGMIMPVGQAIMARTAGPEKMNKVMAVIGIPTLLGPILGPEGRPYVPYLFTLFMVILTLNLMSVVFAVGNIAGARRAFRDLSVGRGYVAAVRRQFLSRRQPWTGR